MKIRYADAVDLFNRGGYLDLQTMKYISPKWYSDEFEKIENRLSAEEYARMSAQPERYLAPPIIRSAVVKCLAAEEMGMSRDDLLLCGVNKDEYSNVFIERKEGDNETCQYGYTQEERNVTDAIASYMKSQGKYDAFLHRAVEIAAAVIEDWLSKYDIQYGDVWKRDGFLVNEKGMKLSWPDAKDLFYLGGYLDLQTMKYIWPKWYFDGLEETEEQLLSEEYERMIAQPERYLTPPIICNMGLHCLAAEEMGMSHDDLLLCGVNKDSYPDVFIERKEGDNEYYLYEQGRKECDMAFKICLFMARRGQASEYFFTLDKIESAIIEGWLSKYGIVYRE